LENEDDEVGAVMETGSVEDEEEGKENQQPAGGRRRAGSVRMGTRVLAARERRAEVVAPAHALDALDLPGLVDVSLRPTVWGDPLPESAEQAGDESLSMSLLERFDAMETEAGEPERRIGTVVMERDGQGRLGVKIGGYPSGVYVDRIDWGVARVVSGSLLEGDRVIGVDQASLESLGYPAALDLLRGAGPTVTLLVSQLR